MPLHAHGLAPPSPRPGVTVREAADGPARRRILHSACQCSPSPHASESGGGGLRNCHRGGEGAEARELSGHGPPVRFWAEKDDWRRIRALGVRAEGGVQVRGCAAERGSRAVCRAHRACRQLFCKHTAWSRKPVTPVRKTAFAASLSRTPPALLGSPRWAQHRAQGWRRSEAVSWAGDREEGGTLPGVVAAGPEHWYGGQRACVSLAWGRSRGLEGYFPSRTPTGVIRGVTPGRDPGVACKEPCVMLCLCRKGS